jgi:hypothetical protein
VAEATSSKQFAQIVRECLMRDPLSRPSAASVTAKFGSINPDQSKLAKALSELRALRAHNNALRNALGQLVASEKAEYTQQGTRESKARQDRSLSTDSSDEKLHGNTGRRASTPGGRRVVRKPVVQIERLRGRKSSARSFPSVITRAVGDVE